MKHIGFFQQMEILEHEPKLFIIGAAAAAADGGTGFLRCKTRVHSPPTTCNQSKTNNLPYHIRRPFFRQTQHLSPLYLEQEREEVSRHVGKDKQRWLLG